MSGHVLKKNRPFLSRARSAWTAVSVVFFCLCVISCRTHEADPLPEKKRDTGIHETYDRGPATVIIDIDRKEITIADRLHLTLTIVVHEDYEAILPGFGEKLEQFGIVDYTTTRPELTGNSRKKISRSYVLEPFLSGDYTIPAMTIEFRKKDAPETETHQIQTSELTVKVRSLLPEDLTDVSLHEIKPPVPLPRSFNIRFWGGLIGGVLILAVIAGIILAKARKRRKADDPGPKIPAHEAAYEALDRLVQDDLINKGAVKIFYQRISAIVRHYIEDRFSLRAPEQTTEEFLGNMETARDFPGEYQTLLRSFLNHCDLVKFAEYQPAPDDIQKTFDSCRAFIDGTAEKEGD